MIHFTTHAILGAIFYGVNASPLPAQDVTLRGNIHLPSVSHLQLENTPGHMLPKRRRYGESRHHRSRMLFDSSRDVPLIRVGHLDVVTGHTDHTLLGVGVHKRAHDGVPGTVDIMTSSSSEKIASLYLDLSSSSNISFILNASDKNSTELYLVPNSDGDDGSNKRVTLQLPVFNSTAAQLVSYCATFDPNPPEPKPMVMEPCRNTTNGANDTSSQMFSYDPNTGVIKPMWLKDDNSTLSTAASEDDRDDYKIPDLVTHTNGTDASNATLPLDEPTLVARDSSPQNVTLVFTPAGPRIASLKDEGSNDSSIEASTATVTATHTTVTTATVAQSSLSSAAFFAQDVESGSTVTVTSTAFSTSTVLESSSTEPSTVTSYSTVFASPTSTETSSTVDASAIASNIAASAFSFLSHDQEEISESVSATESVTAAPSGTETAAFGWMFAPESRL